jgi:hypothetical protein
MWSKTRSKKEEDSGKYAKDKGRAERKVEKGKKVKDKKLKLLLLVA